MKKQTLQLLKEVGKNSLLSMAIFAIVILFLYLIGLADGIKKIAIASGLIGSAYVLIIRNPNNYFGFVFGIISSVLLGIQFYLQESIDLPFLYFFIFIPCQAFTLYTWIRGNNNNGEDKPFNPSFLNRNYFFLTLFLFLLIFVADLLILRKFGDVSHSLAIQIVSALVVATSVLANFLLINKKTDSWYYWVIFSIAGIILNILFKDYVTVTLFSVYFIINANAFYNWVTKTPKENYGWLMKKEKNLK